MKKIVIAIDGFSSCGKSTLAKDLAAKIDFAYIDSGAMYRAVTYYFLTNGININDQDQVQKALKKINIRFKRVSDGSNATYLNGENIEFNIRKMEVSSMVSEVAAIPEVRKKLVEQQREMGIDKGIIMDGRDIGTVVFPNAELKIFLTADIDVRVDRRYRELLEKKLDITKEAVKENLAKRDFIDSTRDDSPLKQAEDAILINNSHLTPEQQLKRSLALELEKGREQ